MKELGERIAERKRMRYTDEQLQIAWKRGKQVSQRIAALVEGNRAKPKNAILMRDLLDKHFYYVRADLWAKREEPVQAAILAEQYDMVARIDQAMFKLGHIIPDESGETEYVPETIEEGVEMLANQLLAMMRGG